MIKPTVPKSTMKSSAGNDSAVKSDSIKSNPIKSGKTAVPAKPPAARNNTGKNAKDVKMAVILIRGLARVQYHIAHTLSLMKLDKKNECVLVENTLEYQGMLQKVKDFITWGEIDPETLKELVSKRGREWTGRLTDRKKKYHYKTLEFNGKKYIPYFYLNSPQKGFEKKGIKVAYAAGGALGYRGDKINNLIKRML